MSYTKFESLIKNLKSSCETGMIICGDRIKQAAGGKNLSMWGRAAGIVLAIGGAVAGGAGDATDTAENHSEKSFREIESLFYNMLDASSGLDVDMFEVKQMLKSVEYDEQIVSYGVRTE